MLQGKAEELRGEIKQLLMKNHTIKPNIHKEEYQALKQLKKDNTRMVLTADKRVSMMVMDREEYIQKSEELLKTQLQDTSNRSDHQIQEQADIYTEVNKIRRGYR